MTLRFCPTLLTLGLACILFPGLTFASTTSPQRDTAELTSWFKASEQGEYDQAVALALDSANALSASDTSSLASLISAASATNLAEMPQWRAFLHYKPSLGGRWLSQVDSPHFFMSDTGKRSPQAELNATLAAFYSRKAKPPLRLTAYCRFIARRYWLADQLPELADLIPEQDCPEFDRYIEYLDADSLTLIFPSAHPNSPSSAFGHTLLRVDKKDQRQESRLLNMSINFAAQVPPSVSTAAYAARGLTGGFRGTFTLLPYHLKLREYGQIENRDTWEYRLLMDKPKVDLVLRHTYEMLISHFDYFFFSENCSYHLLSLLEVAYPEKPLTEHFGLWTIPVDTIRMLRDVGLASEPQFIPSSIRTLRARRSQLPESDAALALRALKTGLPGIEQSLQELAPVRQAGILDLLSDYERYNRLRDDSSAGGSNARERAILSLRSKLGVKSEPTIVKQPDASPDRGHGTGRVTLKYQNNEEQADSIELTIRPAYHDFRDPSKGFDDKATIELGLIGVAYDTEAKEAYLNKFTVLSIESVEPRGDFFKPVSWRTNIKWTRPGLDERHEFKFNAGVGVAYQTSARNPVFFAFGESDLVDAPRFNQRRQLRLGATAGAHWEPINRLRMGLEMSYRRQVGGDYTESESQLWLGLAVAEQLSLNVSVASEDQAGLSATTNTSFEIRAYF